MWDLLKVVYDENNDSYLADVDKLIGLVQSFALYLVIGLLVLSIITAITIKFKRPELMSAFKKIIFGVFMGFAVAIILLIGYLNLVYLIIDEKINTNFYLIIGLLALVFVSLIAGVIIKLTKPKAFKYFTISAVGLAVAYGIVLLCIIPAKKDYYEPLSTTGMYIFSGVLVAVIVALALLFDKQEFNQTTRSIAYASVCIALSYALSFVKFFTLGAQGGSITFASLLPLMIYAYMFGAKKGVFAGVIYGLLQFIQSPQFYQPMQVLLDYPIAFGAIGVAGITKNFKFLKGNHLVQFILGSFIAVTLRYCAHVISGYYVFSSWAWEGYGALAYSIVYNLFCFVDWVIVLIPACFIFTNKGFIKQMLQKK